MRVPVIESVGLPGSGKSYSARALVTCLREIGLRPVHVPGAASTLMSLVWLHCMRLAFSCYFLTRHPACACRLVRTVLSTKQSHQRYLPGVAVNLLFKFGLILWHRDRLIVLDEGIVHASWSAIANAQARGSVLLSAISSVSEVCGVTLCLLLIQVDPATIRRRLIHRCGFEGGRHRLVQRGSLDIVAFERATVLYETVNAHWLPRPKRSVESTPTSRGRSN